MKRFLVLALLAVLALGMTVPALAQVAPADLGALARWVPDKAPIYFGFRTDDDYIATLDAVGQRINAAIPDANIPPLVSSLDDAIRDSGVFGENASFETIVRSWLGDTAAVSVISLATVTATESEDPPVLIAMDVTDRESAEAFWGILETAQDYSRSSEGDFTIFSPPASRDDDQPTVAVGDSVAFIATVPSILPSVEPSAALASADQFSSTLALLPENAYNIVGYLNLGDLLRTILNDSQMDMDMAAIPGPLLTLLESYPPMALGATTLDERSFAVDFALPLATLEAAMAESGLMVTPNAPLNPAFVERIPAGTPLLVHGADLNLSYQQSLRAATMQAEAIANTDAAGGMTQEEIEAEINRTLEQIRFFVQGATGLDLDTELLPALTGDYALYLGLNPALAEATGIMDLMRANPVNFGVLLSVSDPAVTTALVENLTDAIQALPADENTTITIAEETMGGNVVNVITVTSSRDLPFPLQIVIGGDEEVFFIGTPDYARAALSPDGGLLGDDQYQEASVYTLPETRSLLYLASGGLQPLVNVIGETGGTSAGSDADSFAALLSLLSSSSVSTSYADGVSTGRAVWTFPE